jgi:dihydroflavonol-4-reductase
MRAPYSPRRILLTGATGAVGRFLGPALASLAPLRMLEHQTPATDPAFEIVRGDLARPATLRGAAEGCDVVVHAAARTGFASLSRDAQRRINLGGAEALLREAQSAGVRLFVFLGYTGTVQERDDSSQPVDEDTPPEGGYESEYVRMKFETEALVLESNRSAGMTTLVVSPGVLVDPGTETVLGGFVKAFLARELPFRFLNDVWLAPSRGSDVARCVVSAVERGRGGRRYFATAESVRLGEVYDLLAEISGVPSPRRRLPNLLVEELGLLSPVLPAQSFLRQLVLPRELVLHMERLAPVRNERTRADLGFDPTPLRATLEAMAGTEERERRARRASI